MKWFLGLVITWLPFFILMFIAKKLDEFGITTPPSRGGDDLWPLFIAIFGGVGITFLLNYGRKNGEFLDRWLDKVLNKKGVMAKNIGKNMKENLSFTRNLQRWKAIYLLWATFHFIIFVISGNFISYEGQFLPFQERFYPFSKYADMGDYDISELIVYIIIPIVLYFFIKLWKKNNV